MTDQLDRFYFTSNDGYAAVEWFPYPDGDDDSGDLVCFVNAGDTVSDVIRKILEYKRKHGIEDDDHG